jgi:putative integral membrane protein (TIGR02587 family)
MLSRQETDFNPRISTRRGFLFWLGIVRACGGAFVFAFPLLMTMEMWWLGFYMERYRLALCVMALFPLLLRLSYHIGFDESFHWKENFLDTLIAYAVGSAVGALMLLTFGVLKPEMSLDEWVGKITLQTIPASLGAMLARSQFGHRDSEENRKTTYGDTLLLMAVGALFLGLTAAPTEEMVLIAFQMTPWHSIVLVALSLSIAHAFMHAIETRRGNSPPGGQLLWAVFLRFTVMSYAIALALSGFILWSFGRFEQASLEHVVMATVVLAFPATLGASAARLIL